MATPEVLDFAKLLAPIPGDAPAGMNLREESSPVSDYHSIREARKLASNAERAYDMADRRDKEDQKVLPPDWKPVVERSTRVLAEKSKDLEITAYLIEALIRLRGFAGLRDGFRLARELVEGFWDGLHPPAEDMDVEGRFSQILSLNGIDGPGALIVPVRKVAMTELVDEGPFNLSHHQQARALAQVADAKVRQKRIDEGAITLEKIQKAVAATPAKFYINLVEDINRATDEFRGFNAAMASKSGYDPPSSELLSVIESYLDVVKDLARDKLPKGQPASTAAEATVTVEAAAGATPAPATPAFDPAVIRSREDALERIAKVRDYFSQHEPQSILPYALDQIISWGKMSLPELLAELIPEEGPRKNVFGKVGIKK